MIATLKLREGKKKPCFQMEANGGHFIGNPVPSL